MLIKIVLGKQIHLYNGELNLKALIAFVKKAFRNVPDYFVFSYVDQESDKIMISTSQDIEMIRQLVQEKIMKIYVQEDQRFEQILPIQSRGHNFQDLQEILIQTSSNNSSGISIACQSKKQNDDQLIAQLSKNFIYTMGQKAIEKAIEAEQKMMADVAHNYLVGLTQKIAEKVSLEQEKALIDAAQSYLANLTEVVVQRTVIQQEKIIIDATQGYLARLTENIAEKVAIEQEKTIVKVTQDYLACLTENISQKVAIQEEKTMQNRFSMARRVSKIGRAKSAQRKSIRKSVVTTITQKQIDKRVQQKIRQLLPSLIEKITKKIESKMIKTSCVKCDRTQISVEKLISKRLINKHRANYKKRDQKSLNKSRFENPQI